MKTLTKWALVLVLFTVVCSGQVKAESMEDRGWRRIDPAEITDNPVTLFGKNWLALAVGDQESSNAMTIGWGGLGTLWGLDNPVVTMYIEQSRNTHEFLNRHERYTLTAFSDQYRDALVYLGSHSGRNEEKMSGSGLTVGFTENGTPYFEEGRLLLECSKIYAHPLSPDGMGEKGLKNYDGGKRVFTMFIADIVNVWVKDN